MSQIFTQKTKAKRDSFWRVGTLPFIALWAAAYPLAWVTVIFLFESVDIFDNLSSTQANVVGISTVLLVSALLHVQIVERLLKHSMRGWMIYTLIGTVVTFFTFTNIESDAMWPTALTVMSLLLPAPLIQTLWLRKQVHVAWLWPLASIVACLVFALPLRGATSQSTIVWAALLQGLIQGGVMRHLWTQVRENKKNIGNFAVQEQPEPIQRLQETRDADDLTTSPSEERVSQRSRL